MILFKNKILKKKEKIQKSSIDNKYTEGLYLFLCDNRIG